jgi:V/A-type H+-transporting ATPase subunit K
MENLLTWPLMVTLLVVLGLVLMLGLTSIGSAIGVSNAGNALIGGMRKNPDMFGKGLILCALPSTQGLYGFAAFFLFLIKLSKMSSLTFMQAVLIFVTGVAMGCAGYLSALYQSKVVCNGITEISNGRDVFGNTLILSVFPELYAILTFAAAFLAWVFAL